MLVKIRPELAAAGLDIGRDKFFALLRSRELLVPAPHPAYHLGRAATVP